MPDYAKLYRHLFNAATDAVELLKNAQKETEEMYLSAPDPEVRLLPTDDNQPGDGDEP